MPVLQRKKVRSVKQLEALRVPYRKNQRPLECPEKYCVPPPVSAAGVTGPICHHKFRNVPIDVYERERDAYYTKYPHIATIRQWEIEHGD